MNPDGSGGKQRHQPSRERRHSALPAGAARLPAPEGGDANVCAARDRPSGHARPAASLMPRRSPMGRATRQLQSSSFLHRGQSAAAPATSAGSLRLRVVVGDPGTAADEADVTRHLLAHRRPAASRPSGLHGRAARHARPSHHGPRDQPFTQAATTVDLPFDYDVGWAATPGPRTGRGLLSVHHGGCRDAQCLVKEGRRAIWEVGQVQVFDCGADGVANTTADNTLFETQGVFAPDLPRRFPQVWPRPRRSRSRRSAPSRPGRTGAPCSRRPRSSPSVPVTSIVTVRLETSTMRARKMSASCMISPRV